MSENQQQTIAEQQEEKMKKNYDDFVKTVEKESKKEVPLPNSIMASD